MILRLIRICKQNNVKLLFSAIRYCNILTLIANYFLNINIVIREANTFDSILKGINNDSYQFRVKTKIVLLLMKILYRNANFIIGISTDVIKDIQYYINVPENKIKLINNPIFNENNPDFKATSLNDDRFNKLPHPILISIGRLVYQKNYEHLIRCFKLVVQKIDSAQLVILGVGPDQKRLLALTKDLNIIDRVHFLGFVENPYIYLRKSDLFVLSSRYEGFGNVIVEALAVGLPVVSTNCPGGPKEILDNGKYGKLVPIKDINAMAKAIIYTLQERVNKNDLISRAHKYSVKTISEEYINLFMGIMKD